MSQDKRTREDLYKERLEVFHREAHLFTDVHESIACRSAIALYGINDQKMPRPVGSGVLFSCGEKLFILTAAHVADEFKRKPVLITKGAGFLRLRGHMHLSSLPASGRRNDDLLDFAVMTVDGEIAEVLRPLAMTAENLYLPPPGMFNWNGYVLVGFPARSFRVKGPDLSCTASVLQTAELLPQRYSRLKVHPGTHIALQWFNTMYSSKGVVRTQSLAGVSGGGVWLVPAMMHDLFRGQVPFSQPKLIGIFTAHLKRESALLATKVHFHMDTIIKRHPELSLSRIRVRDWADL